jgi:hypothetical protein
VGENKINTINLNDIFQDVKTDLIGNLLNETKDSKKCMWYLICALDGMGDQEILELSGYTIPQIQDARTKFLKQKYQAKTSLSNEIQMLKKQVMDVVKENRDVRSSVEAGLDKAIQEQIEKSNKLIEAKDEMITMINMQKVDLQRQNEELKAKVNELEKQSTSVVAATSNPADRKDAWKFKYGIKEGSVNVSAFIREKLFREEIKELAYYRELKNLTYQIRKIGVNINQVAAKINSGHGNIDSVFYLQKNLLQVEEEVKNLIEKLEEDRGNHKIDEH